MKIVVLKTIKERQLNHVDSSVLISAGLLGYAQSLNRFQPARGVKFKTFAEYRIRGAVLDEVRRQIGDERTQIKRPKEVDIETQAICDDGSQEAVIQENLDMRSLIEKMDLSEKEDEILRLRMAGMTVKEICQKFKLKEKVVLSLLACLRRRLYSWFRDHLGADFNVVERDCPCGHVNEISNRGQHFECERCGLELEVTVSNKVRGAYFELQV